MLRQVALLLVAWLALFVAACPSNESDEAAAGGAKQQQTTGSGPTAGPTTTTTAGGTTTSAVSTGTGASATEVKVAFIGDSGNGSAFQSVLDLALAEQVDAVVHNGDFDYGLDPDAFFATVDAKMGASFPYFVAVGNHDAPAWNEYSVYAAAHFRAAGVTLDDPNLLDQKFAFVYQGIRFVFVGENGENEEFAQFIDDQLDPNEDAWKVCGWHKNQRAMQIGGKGDEMGWDVYENCRLNGAIVTTGHEHSYERTKTLTEMESQTVDDTCSAPNQLCVGPGKTFAVVSGLGGVGIRDQERCLPTTPPYGCNGEWASIFASDQDANYGALFIIFNAGGDPKKAHGYFKSVDGRIIDEFDVTRSP